MANTPLQFLLMSVCILVTQNTKSVYGDITLGMLNRVAYEGSTNTRLTCEGNSAYVDWTLSPSASTGGVWFQRLAITHSGVPTFFNESFAIEHSQGTEVYTLVVLNATISPYNRNYSTAGFYGCRDDGTPIFAQLVVIRSDPICASNFTQSTGLLQSGDVVQLSCTIVYGGFRTQPIDAVMTWSVNGEQISTDNATITLNPTSKEITASLNLLINDNYDATYECETTFSQPPSSSLNAAINAPDYYKKCTISQLTTQSPTTTAESQSTSSQQTITSPLSTTIITTVRPTAEVTSATVEETLTPSSSFSTSTTNDLPTTLNPTSTTTPHSSITTVTTKTSSASAPTTTTGLPPSCTPSLLELLFHFLGLDLRASCYDDWNRCSVVGILLQSCRNSCKSSGFSGGTCESSPSVGCPCVPPGNKKCKCSD